MIAKEFMDKYLLANKNDYVIKSELFNKYRYYETNIMHRVGLNKKYFFMQVKAYFDVEEYRPYKKDSAGRTCRIMALKGIAWNLHGVDKNG